MDLYGLADRKDETKKERKKGKAEEFNVERLLSIPHFPFIFSDLCTVLLFREVFVQNGSAAGSCYTHFTATDALSNCPASVSILL